MQMSSMETWDELQLEPVLNPQYQQVLNKMLIATSDDIPSCHPGERVFSYDFYLQLFSYPDLLSLSSSAFLAVKSRMDRQLASLSGDDLVQFLNPASISGKFNTISRPHEFSTFVFYLLSLTEDIVKTSHLTKILFNIIEQSEWVPNVETVCRLLVNYGTTLTQLCPDETCATVLSLLPAYSKWMQKSEASQTASNGFLVENFLGVMQVLTYALVTRSKQYTIDDCLTLAVVIMRVSLDTKLAGKKAHLCLRCFFDALFKAVSEDQWPIWVSRLCNSAAVLSLTDHHHNMAYLVDLLPANGRGGYMRRVISYVFLQRLLQCDIDNLLETKVKKSVILLKALPTNLDDYYFVWSVTKLVEYSIGLDSISQDEKDDLRALINALHYRLSKISSQLNLNVGQSMYRTQAVMIGAKWDAVYKQLDSETIFWSPVKFKSQMVVPEDEPLHDLSNEIELMLHMISE